MFVWRATALRRIFAELTAEHAEYSPNILGGSVTHEGVCNASKNPCICAYIG
eukprot:SAG11_NODE_25393_length_359_cov_0.957692_1_plen_51_part_10